MRRLSNLGLATALAGIGRRFLAEPGSRNRRNMFRGNIYSPNGDREVRRRLRKEIRALAKRAIEVLSVETTHYTQVQYVTVWEQLTQDSENYHKFQTASPEQLIQIRDNLLADLKGAPDFA